MSDALADYCKRRWPHHTAKYAAREWNLTLDEGKGCAKAMASKATIEKVFKKGGLLLALHIVEQVTGEQIAQYLHHLGHQHENNGRRLDALLGDGRSFSSPRHHGPDSLGPEEPDGREPDRRRVG